MDLQVALIALVGVAGILGTLRSAEIAARASREAAQLSNQEARQARSEEAVRPLAAQLLRAAEEHLSQVSAQVAWRSDPNRPRPMEAPTIESTEPIYLLIAELHMMVQEPLTASSGWELYQAAVALDRWAYQPDLHLRDGHVATIDEQKRQEFERQANDYVRFRRRFINAGRVEFGRAPFPEDDNETEPRSVAG